MNDEGVSLEQKKCWQLESLGITGGIEPSSHDRKVFTAFNKSIELRDNRYEVCLPWKDLQADLHDNRAVAVKWPCRTNSRHEGCGYHMPHGEVIKELSTTTKLRIIFDASSHGTEMTLLSDHLEKGPNLSNNMLKMLLRFRQHQVGVVADVPKAFLQIGIKPCDRDTLRSFGFKKHQEKYMTCIRFVITA